MGIGAILGGIGSLIGGLGGTGLFGGGSSAEGGGTKKAKHHALDYDRRRIKALVDGAKDAGIHPLAVLGAASGGGSFAAPVQSASGPGIGDAIGAGMSAFADLYQSEQDRQNYEDDRAYNESMRRRQDAIDNLRSKEITPEVKLQRENMALQNDLLRMDIARSRTALMQARAGALRSTTGKSLTDALGITMMPPKGRASAQQMQDEYGDIVENVYGVGNWIQDMWSARSPSWWPESVTIDMPNVGKGAIVPPPLY